MDIHGRARLGSVGPGRAWRCRARLGDARQGKDEVIITWHGVARRG